MKKSFLFFLILTFLISSFTLSPAETCNCNCPCNKDPYLSDINSWNPTVDAKIEEFFAKIERGDIKNPVAVFDADGTLWSNDLGESFFKWLIENKKLTGVDYSKDLYQEYEDLLKEDKGKAFAFPVTLMNGLKEDDVRKWADEYFKNRFIQNIYPEQKELIKRLQEAGVDVWIVSASNTWSVETAAPYLGIEPDHVIAMRSEVTDGIITDKMVLPLLHGPGKVEGIKKYIGDRVDFASGNSRSDYEMLEFSSEMSLIINPSDKEDIEKTSLLKESEEKGWAIQKWNR